MTPNDPCGTCAFGKSGGAAGEPYSHLKAQICAMGGIPFFCHHGTDGVEYDWRNKTGLGPLSLPPNQRRMCAGWKSAVRRIFTIGPLSEVLARCSPADRPSLLRYQHQLARRANTLLDEMITEDNLPAKDKIAEDLRDCVVALRGE